MVCAEWRMARARAAQSRAQLADDAPIQFKEIAFTCRWSHRKYQQPASPFSEKTGMAYRNLGVAE
jgi:hypothetical protein